MSTATHDLVIEDVIVAADNLQARVAELGAEISRDYEGKTPLLVGILKGAVFFMADLMRNIDIPCEVDYMAVSSYGHATESSGVVRVLKDLDASIEGRHVIIVEDIIDSGLTLSHLLKTLSLRNPASIEIATLLVKPERRQVDVPCRYTGFEIANKFVVGYGLDFRERYRNLDFIAALHPSSYADEPDSLEPRRDEIPSGEAGTA